MTPVADVLLTSRMDVREDVKKAKQRLEKTQWELKDYAQQAKVMVDDLTQEKRKLEKISEVIFGFSQFYTKGKSLDERIQTLEKQLGVDEHTPTMAHFGSTKREMERIKRYLKEVYRKVLGQEPPWL